MRIDRAKLKAAIKKAEAFEAGSWTFPSNPYPLLLTQEKRKSLKCGYVKFHRPIDAERLKTGAGNHWHLWAASECQVLYALMAHSRNRLAMKKMWIPRGDTSGELDSVEFTKEMQKELVGDAWKEFLLPEPLLAPPELPSSASSAP